MRIADIGEFGLIDLVAKTISNFTLADLSPHISSPSVPLFPQPRVLVAIGDDTAVWQTEVPIQLSTTDTLVQDVHFTLKFATWRELGWKALAVNISDVASMGGYPRYAILTLGLPQDLDAEHVVELYKGMMDIALRYGVALVGGDMVASKEVFITAALTGEESPQPGAKVEYLLRSQAGPGDKIAVTGYLGSSAAGLKMLLEGSQLESEEAEYLREAHLRPVPRVLEGMLIRRSGAKCAMDISDGLLADLTKVCKASGVGGTVFADRLPINPIVRAVFPDEAETLALSGGEDYELLFTGPEEVVERVKKESEIPVTVIGEITKENAGHVRVLGANGEEFQLRRAGWDHFSRS